MKMVWMWTLSKWHSYWPPWCILWTCFALLSEVTVGLWQACLFFLWHFPAVCVCIIHPVVWPDQIWPPCRGGGWGCPWCRRRPCHHESSPRLVQLEPGRQRHGAVQNTVGKDINIFTFCYLAFCMPCSGRRFYLRMRNCKRKNQVCTA